MEAYSQWKERYLYIDKVTDSWNGFTKQVGRWTHKLYRSKNSSTGWFYKAYWEKQGVPYWKSPEYSYGANVEKTFFKIKHSLTNPGEYSVECYIGDTLVIDEPHASGVIEPGKTIFTGTEQGTSFVGKNIMIGEMRRETTNQSGQKIEYYEVIREGKKTVRIEQKDTAEVLEFIGPGTVEKLAYYIGSGPGDPEYQNDKDAAYLLRTFIIRSGKLYARTNQDAAQELTTSTLPVLEEVHYLRDFLRGWTYVSPIEKLKPFDGKNYTKISKSGPISFKVKAGEKFDTIALTGVVARKISIGGIVTDYRPDGSRDPGGRLPDVGTTVILYSGSDKPAGTEIDITIEGGHVELGGIYFGLSIDAGFTNLSFTNRYHDYSPYEKDQWGNITYIEGAKINTYNGTVDVPIRRYDQMNRLMVSLGKSKIILNGSDTKDNQPIRNQNDIFASTMVVGRMIDFELRTKLDNKRIGEMATYSFKIEEEV
jgi:hypothetical protein